MASCSPWPGGCPFFPPASDAPWQQIRKASKAARTSYGRPRRRRNEVLLQWNGGRSTGPDVLFARQRASCSWPYFYGFSSTMFLLTFFPHPVLVSEVSSCCLRLPFLSFSCFFSSYRQMISSFIAFPLVLLLLSTRIPNKNLNPPMNTNTM